MKIEIGSQRPEVFTPIWEGQYDVFSHFESACGIPSVLFAVTTLKENGKPNVCFNAWSSFTGDGGGYYAVMGGIDNGSHTYKNIMRTGEFVINFISQQYFDACLATIDKNDDSTDEFEVGGFTIEEAKTVACPRMAEAFLSVECKLDKEVDLPGCTRTVLLLGNVNHMAMQEGYAGSIDGKYEDDGFMFYIPTPINLKTGESGANAVAVCKVVRVNDEGMA